MSRRIKAMVLPGIIPGGADMPEPVMSRAAPTELLVDATYQRDLSYRSVDLIRKMVARWDWRSFQPPLVVKTAQGLHVVDGQHTAIAAASHPKIKTIPILLVEAPEIKQRARAFIGRNRDRIIVTPTQLHHAAVAAGDEDALTIDQICRRAGVRILKNPPFNAIWREGDTVAIGCIRAVLYRRHAMKTRRVLELLAKAKLSPISACAIRAAEALMFDERWAPAPESDDITTAIRSLGTAGERQAHVAAAADGTQRWKAFADLLATRLRRGHRRAA